jgi:hypothetical protein
MMKNLTIVKKMYRVFDELHTNEETALHVLKGWQHKNHITEVYAVGFKSDLAPNFIKDLSNIYLAKTEAEAIEEANEMNS